MYIWLNITFGQSRLKWARTDADRPVRKQIFNNLSITKLF